MNTVDFTYLYNKHIKEALIGKDKYKNENIHLVLDDCVIQLYPDGD